MPDGGPVSAAPYKPSRGPDLRPASVGRFSRRAPVEGSGRHSTPDGPGYGPYDPPGWLSVTYSTAVRVWTATDSSKSSTVMYSFWLPMLWGYGP